MIQKAKKLFKRHWIIDGWSNIIVIAHRLSTIVHADKIVVLDNGRVQEMGTHQELMQTGGLYSHLYNIQFSNKKAK